MPTEHPHPLADRRTVVRAAPASVVARLQLTPEEGFLLSRLDRPMAVGDLLASSGLAEARGRVVLQNLWTKGAIRAGAEEHEPGNTKPPPSPWGDFVFTPADLQEPGDLPIELRKEVLYLHAHLKSWSHWRLLGIKPDASPTEVRKAFLDGSKKFHPDNFFRKQIGSFKPRLDAIFQRLKLAADVLADDAARARYEREGAAQFTAEEKVILAGAEVRRLENEKRLESRRRGLLQGKGFVKTTRAREAMSEGDALLAERDAKGALAAYQRALELDPRLDAARARIQEAHRVALSQRSDLAVSEAKKLLEEGSFDRARDLLRQAVEGDASNEQAVVMLAELLAARGGDANDIRRYAQKAIELGVKVADMRVLAVRAYLELGLAKNARREAELLEAAGDPRAKALLKLC